MTPQGDHHKGGKAIEVAIHRPTVLGVYLQVTEIRVILKARLREEFMSKAELKNPTDFTTGSHSGNDPGILTACYSSHAVTTRRP